MSGGYGGVPFWVLHPNKKKYFIISEMEPLGTLGSVGRRSRYAT